jgi:hypothetical protein
MIWSILSYHQKVHVHLVDQVSSQKRDDDGRGESCEIESLPIGYNP